MLTDKGIKRLELALPVNDVLRPLDGRRDLGARRHKYSGSIDECAPVLPVLVGNLIRLALDRESGDAVM